MPVSPVLAPAAAHDLWTADPQRVCFVDCRFDLKDTEAGGAAYREAHLPEARYAHLDRHLSGPVDPGRSGRHPLPDPKSFSATLRAWGVSGDSHVIAYDQGGGPFAARLWWMLHWIGHTRQSVLDGGLDLWRRRNLPVTAAVPAPQAGDFRPALRRDMEASVEDVESAVEAGDQSLVDCRSADRYAGQADAMDPVSGHIPGAVNLPHGETLGDDGRFLSPASLRRKLEGLSPDLDPTESACYCGSGVSACHVILAFHHAGLDMPRNYIGSWSQWITDPERPVQSVAD